MDDKKLLQRLINQVAKDKNADPTQVKDFLARVVALESGRSFDPTIKQKTEKSVGPGRGLSQIEVNGKGGSNRIVSTIGRAINYYNSKNEEIPEFISDIKDEIYTNGTFDVSTISKEKQLLLTLADFRMGNGDLGKVFSGEIDTSDMWLDHWWQGKDSEREKKLKYYHDTMSSYDQNEFFSNLYDEDLDSNKEEFKFENMKSSGSDTLDAFANSSPSGNNFNDLLNSIKQKTTYNNTIQSYDKLQSTEKDFEKSLKDSQNASATEGDEFNIKPVENTFNQGGNINKNFNFRTKQINSFNEGGLHSENSLGGIPQGAGKNGKPNLVEEGESSYTFKDGFKFIFSHKGLGQKNSNSNIFNRGGNLNGPGDKDKNKKNNPPTEDYSFPFLSNENPIIGPKRPTKEEKRLGYSDRKPLSFNSDKPHLKAIEQGINEVATQIGYSYGISNKTINKFSRLLPGLSNQETKINNNEGTSKSIIADNIGGNNIGKPILKTYESIWNTATNFFKKEGEKKQDYQLEIEAYKKYPNSPEKFKQYFHALKEKNEEIKSNKGQLKDNLNSSVGPFSTKDITDYAVKELGIEKSDLYGIRNSNSKELKKGSQVALSYLAENYNKFKEKYPELSEDELVDLTMVSYNNKAKTEDPKFIKYYIKDKKLKDDYLEKIKSYKIK